jgi:hypothetical protein
MAKQTEPTLSLPATFTDTLVVCVDAAWTLPDGRALAAVASGLFPTLFPSADCAALNHLAKSGLVPAQALSALAAFGLVPTEMDSLLAGITTTTTKRFPARSPGSAETAPKKGERWQGTLARAVAARWLPTVAEALTAHPMPAAVGPASAGLDGGSGGGGGSAAAGSAPAGAGDSGGSSGTIIAGAGTRGQPAPSVRALVDILRGSATTSPSHPAPTVATTSALPPTDALAVDAGADADGEAARKRARLGAPAGEGAGEGEAAAATRTAAPSPAPAPAPAPAPGLGVLGTISGMAAATAQVDAPPPPPDVDEDEVEFVDVPPRTPVNGDPTAAAAAAAELVRALAHGIRSTRVCVACGSGCGGPQRMPLDAHAFRPVRVLPGKGNGEGGPWGYAVCVREVRGLRLA